MTDSFSPSQNSFDTQPVLADASFLPGPVLLLGAPGVGKGTQAQILMTRFGIPQISTGDILRDHIRRGTALGKNAQSLMDEGQLVPDNLVNEMVALRLSESDVLTGYILDGFPRTLLQAGWLDAQLPMFRSMPPLIAVALEVDRTELLRRITGRRICPACKSIYNIYSKPSQKEGFCDNDNSPLQHRRDDTEEAFLERMKVYESLTAPVIAHYAASNRFSKVDGAGAVDDVAADLFMVLRQLREQFPSGTYNSQAL